MTYRGPARAPLFLVAALFSSSCCSLLPHAERRVGHLDFIDGGNGRIAGATAVVAARGETCDDLEAVVAAAYGSCSSACDVPTAQARAEALAVNACEAFCALRLCPGAQLQTTSVASECTRESERCGQSASMMSLALLDVGRRFNCTCHPSG